MTVDDCSRRRLLKTAGILCGVGLAGGAGTHALLSRERTFPSNSIQVSSFDLQVACLRDDGFTEPTQDSDSFPTTFVDASDMELPLSITAGEARRLTVALKASQSVETRLRVSGAETTESEPAFELSVWEDTDADADWEHDDGTIQSDKTPVVVDDLPVDVQLGRCDTTGETQNIGLEWTVPSDAPTGDYTVELEFIARQCTE
jgi:hypothetical protein